MNNLLRQVTHGEVVRAVTGHVTERVTEHYSHVGRDEKATAVAQVVSLVSRLPTQVVRRGVTEEMPYNPVMPAFKARAQGGRIVLDEPTNLPEGAEVRLLAVDGDDLDERDRKELHAAIEAGERELDLGRGVAEDELWARLRAIP